MELLSIFREKFPEKARFSKKMHEMHGSTLYLMDGLTLFRDKGASYFRNFFIVKVAVELGSIHI